MEILQKGTASAKFRAIRPKLCGNCSFPQNFHTRKLGETTVFYEVNGIGSLLFKHTFDGLEKSGKSLAPVAGITANTADNTTTSIVPTSTTVGCFTRNVAYLMEERQ